MQANEVNLGKLFFSWNEVEDSSDGLSKFLNMALADSNLDEVRWMKALHYNAEWRVGVECIPCSSRTGVTDLDEEGHDSMMCGGEKVVTWLKVELLLSLTGDFPFKT